jgi:NADP-dependent 3-hydroxy acid dehydrogenase YdfG
LTRRLQDTVALVTGASSGIGAAIARRLAAEGAAVALVARRLDRLDDLTARIRSDEGTRALVLQANVTDQGQAVAAVERTAPPSSDGSTSSSTTPGSCCSVRHSRARSTSGTGWSRSMSRARCTSRMPRFRIWCAPLRTRRAADLINISSTAGRLARPGGGVYSLTKFGIAAFAESLRQELIAQRVRVSVVEPGTVDTELVSHLREDLRRAAQSQVESIEPLQPEDIADAAAYIVTRDRRVAVNEMLVRAAEQTW